MTNAGSETGVVFVIGGTDVKSKSKLLHPTVKRVSMIVKSDLGVGASVPV